MNWLTTIESRWKIYSDAVVINYIVIQILTESFSYDTYVKYLVLKGIEIYKNDKNFYNVKMHV